ncbi:MAG: hypothetical protein A3C90_04100 [Candidatus Magasanikbacteria bacterium RIFCSPHIGHO2_02_FULL_51_14]|uniref:Uncharacterized protein n=1 Tax=Candidatus Magasanikbacteria bacterium RIFCSPHIGHO2_02_FULL_51_14 TaxID=1798683 RepID=A0A1F6MGM0_9BACT|nr:MAG: hypothetical protein A3C90_04100 [Candidatus Magasanikbacteria bacterium RIFCSPHIGHO2_02_FULL_51_14]
MGATIHRHLHRTISITHQGEREDREVIVIPDSKERLVLSENERTLLLWDETRRVWREYRNIFSLFRAICHAIAGYRFDELPELAKHIRDLEALCLDFLDFTSEDAESANGQHILGELQGICDWLENVIDANKRDARDTANSIVSKALRDSNGRHNPPALNARRQRIRNRLVARQTDALIKFAYEKRMQALVWRMILALEEQNMIALRAIREASAARPGTDVSRYLKVAGDAVSATRAEPYCAARKRLLEDMSAAESALHRDKRDELKRRLCATENSLVLKRLRLRLELAHVAFIRFEHDPILFSQEERTRFANRLGAVKACIDTVDETCFERPVCGAVTERLAKALALVRRDGKTKIKEFKKLVEDAADLI